MVYWFSVPFLIPHPDEAKSRTRFVFSKAGVSDLFTTRAMHSVCSLYFNDVTKNDTYLLSYEPASLGLYAARTNGKSACLEVSEDDVSKFRSLLQFCSQFYLNGMLNDECEYEGYCSGVPRNCSVLNAVYFTYYFLVPAGSAAQIAEGKFDDVKYTMVVSRLYTYGDKVQDIYQNNIMGRSISDGVTKLCAVGSDLKYDLFSDLLISDFKYMAIGMGLILGLVWIYTGSLFVTLMTILDMVMSLVLSYFLYKVVFGLPFFPFVNVLAVVLVIGIGADDAFVYVDIWKKMRERHGSQVEQRVVVLQDTLHHAAITMFVTSFTTSSALFATVISSITAIRCLAVYAGCAIIINFIYTVTWLPAIVIIEDKYLQFRTCRSKIKPNWCSSGIKKFYNDLSKGVRSFCENIIPLVVFKLRYLWIFVLLLLGVGGACTIFVIPKLRLPTQTDFQVFISTDYTEQYDQKIKKLFPFEEQNPHPLPILFVWGLEPVDNGNPWDPDDSGSIIIDKSFNLSSKASQKWLLTFCENVRNQTFYSPRDKLYDVCFIEIMKSLMESSCENTGLPLNFDASPCCNQSEFPYEPALFDHCAPLVTSVRHLQSIVRFGKRKEITGLMTSFTSTTVDSLVYENISEFWYTIDSWSKQQMQTAPEGMTGGWFVSQSYDQMYFFDIQESLATGTPVSIGLSLGVAALVLLLTTRNLLITLYAMLSISATVFVTIGGLVLMGWELNILESTVMSLAVGLSVDFTIHYGVAYRIAPHKDRASRSRFAMTQLTSAITTAALSTFIAGAVMLPSSVLCYRQIAIFLTLVMTVSWFYANFFFMSLCRAVGPEGNCTQIPMPSCGTPRGGQNNTCRKSYCCCTQQADSTVLDQALIGEMNLGYVVDS